MRRCVVWTGDGRVFFYNPSSRISVWERPDDLVGRQDVDKMISTPPDAIGATKPTRQSDTSESSDDDQPTPAKKMKHDDTKSNCYYEMKYTRLHQSFYTSSVLSFRHTHQGRGREGRKKDHRHR